MLKRIPFYPFLLAAYPVLVLGAYNISQIAPGDILRPLLLSLLAAGVVFGLVRLFLRDWHRAALVAAFVLLLFLSYGQVYAGAKQAGILFMRHRVLILLWGGLLLAGIVYIFGRLKEPAAWTPWLNLICALMLVYPFWVISSSMVQEQLGGRAAAAGVHPAAAASQAEQPDIYYIILDAYARQDALLEDFGYDNSAFIQALEDRGFYVADCAQSNYAQTSLSIPAALNYDYLENLRPKFGRSELAQGLFIKHSAVRAFLEQRGYKTAAFATGYPFTEIRDADRFMEPAYHSSVATPFEGLFVKTTLLRMATDFGRINLEPATESEYFRQRTTFAFENLKELPRNDGAYFVYGHIIIPHPPYVFGPRGERVYYGGTAAKGELGLTEQQHLQGYRDQVTYANQRMLEIVDTILEQSDVQPIIILQGDHGAPRASHSARMHILNAYYAPRATNMLYPAITPVNSFRVVLNAYFGQNLPLLEDRSYYSSYGQDWRHFQEIPPSCPGE